MPFHENNSNVFMLVPAEPFLLLSDQVEDITISHPLLDISASY